ncbi:MULTISPECIES: hypothetical protein [Rhodococcus]|uniref:Uncharacterized protein n=1 Tax=Rhodococcus rhodochrous J45 TaxID=935266 RepID=A0A562D971_RHORH|nr:MULTISPECIES: hypothetical protein [Rhodococcus]MXQ77837.1 hypothetical protein [Rhodococcus rhodochrous]OWY82987.1 hypothetical protein B9C99_03750 [Rhodococcus sp. BUPNP1]TWH06162.1 hypothetical protein L618_000700000610 [Rhodococcus rhodochrous J45]
MEYNAMIEIDADLDLLTDDETVDLIEPIVPHHGAVGRSDNGRAQLIITVDAVDAIHALRFVRDLMQDSYPSYRVNAVDVLPTSAFDAIYGFGDYFA